MSIYIIKIRFAICLINSIIMRSKFEIITELELNIKFKMNIKFELNIDDILIILMIDFMKLL